jgi:chemotaxis protein methyltransferase CheR
MTTLTKADFNSIAAIIYRVAGIALGEGKLDLVQSRLRKRLAQTGRDTYSDYVDYVRGAAGDKELQLMIDAITTNETRFFREPAHFSFLRDVVFRQVSKPLRIWCAAAATGEEPYSIAIAVRDHFPHAAETRVLATDINNEVINVARQGIYNESRLASLPEAVRQKHFRCISNAGSNRQYQVKAETRDLVRFARLNLVDDWPMRGVFDVIFLRNVMIYFNGPTRIWLGARACTRLRPGGYLFIGHSESLGINPPGYRNVQPAIYQRTAEAAFAPPRRPL